MCVNSKNVQTTSMFVTTVSASCFNHLNYAENGERIVTTQETKYY